MYIYNLLIVMDGTKCRSVEHLMPRVHTSIIYPKLDYRPFVCRPTYAQLSRWTVSTNQIILTIEVIPQRALHCH